MLFDLKAFALSILLLNFGFMELSFEEKIMTILFFPLFYLFGLFLYLICIVHDLLEKYR